MSGYAFHNNRYLTGITIPESVVSIGNEAFMSALHLKTVSIPNSVTNIENAAFQNVRELAGFSVGEKNPNYCSENGVLYSKDKTTLIAYPRAKDGTEFTIPDSLKTIAGAAFYEANNQTRIVV
ncbi:MAG: leucine-rich repeat protein, partial [Oscillospiraceae bacterium]|nr:leucine-rich repeat protein [Oscillospiraceae bacterium]